MINNNNRYTRGVVVLLVVVVVMLGVADRERYNMRVGSSASRTGAETGWLFGSSITVPIPSLPSLILSNAEELEKQVFLSEKPNQLKGGEKGSDISTASCYLHPIFRARPIPRVATITKGFSTRPITVATTTTRRPIHQCFPWLPPTASPLSTAAKHLGALKQQRHKHFVYRWACPALAALTWQVAAAWVFHETSISSATVECTH